MKCIIKIQYDNITIYDNHIDDLATSVSGQLELKLRFRKLSTVSSVIVKYIKSQICLIPKCPKCFDNNYEYIPIIMTQEKFKELWFAMKYNPCSDMDYINQITSDDILLMWLISSNCRYSVDNIKDYINHLYSKILCTSRDNDLFQDLINKLFYNHSEEVIVKTTIMDTLSTMEKVIIYLDKKTNYEWDAFRMDNNNIYLNLGMDKCIPIVEKK